MDKTDISKTIRPKRTKRFLPGRLGYSSKKSGFSRLGRGDILAPAILMVEEVFQAEVATADREL